MVKPKNPKKSSFSLYRQSKKISKIFIAEYNPYFGSELEITVPNIKNFNRTNYHYSNLCWGVSLKALIKIMELKGYIFIGSND